MKQPKPLRLALRLLTALVVVALCVWLLRRMDLAAVGHALAHASLALVALSVAANLVGVVLRASYLHVLLRPLRNVPVRRLLGYHLAACAASNLLPGRAGELVRIYLLRRREEVPVPSAVALSLVEKCVLLGALLLTMLPLPLLLPRLPAAGQAALWTLAGLGLGALAAAFVVARLDRLPWLARRVPPWLHRFVEGVHVMRHGRYFAAALGLALLIWAADAGGLWLVLRALAVPASVGATLLGLLALNLAIALPSTPGQLGAFEAGAVLGLKMAGVPSEQALAAALVYHVVQALPVTLLGLGGLRLAREAEASEAALAQPMEPQPEAEPRAAGRG